MSSQHRIRTVFTDYQRSHKFHLYLNLTQFVWSKTENLQKLKQFLSQDPQASSQKKTFYHSLRTQNKPGMDANTHLPTLTVLMAD